MDTRQVAGENVDVVGLCDLYDVEVFNSLCLQILCGLVEFDAGETWLGVLFRR